MPDPTPLRTAEFSPRLKTYWLLSTIIICTVTVIGIPLLVVIIPLCLLFMDRYIASLGCTLTDRTLEIKKGIFNTTESTIPLEKITDLQLYQGPIMRMLDLEGFKVETAGQSAGPGASLINMIGIVGTRDFREAVLAQRDRREDQGSGSRAAPPPGRSTQTDDAELLRDIRDTLRRIEGRLESTTGTP